MLKQHCGMLGLMMDWIIQDILMTYIYFFTLRLFSHYSSIFFLSLILYHLFCVIVLWLKRYIDGYYLLLLFFHTNQFFFSFYYFECKYSLIVMTPMHLHRSVWIEIHGYSFIHTLSGKLFETHTFELKSKCVIFFYQFSIIVHFSIRRNLVFFHTMIKNITFWWDIYIYFVHICVSPFILPKLCYWLVIEVGYILLGCDWVMYERFELFQRKAL